jgi:small-conductance mechanosensitive channel
MGIVAAGGYFGLSSLAGAVAFAKMIQDAFFVGGVLIGLYGGVRVIKAVIKWYHHEIGLKTKTDIDDRFLPIIKKILYIFAAVIALIIILDHFAIEITPLIAGLGIGGLVIALALQDTLSNFFAGTSVATEGTVNVGDFIELETGLKGTVEEVSWRATKIKTLQDNIVVVPNSKLASTIFTNYSAPFTEMSVVVPVGVGYNEDLEKVEKITVEVAKKILENVPGGKKDFQPLIRFREFGDSNINFSVILRVENPRNKYTVIHEFIKALKKRYDKEGIEISFPARKIYYPEDKGKDFKRK